MTPLIPRIESAKVGSISLAYLIRPGSDFRGDWIRCDTGPMQFCFRHACTDAALSNLRYCSATSFPGFPVWSEASYSLRPFALIVPGPALKREKAWSHLQKFPYVLC